MADYQNDRFIVKRKIYFVDCGGGKRGLWESGWKCRGRSVFVKNGGVYGSGGGKTGDPH